MANVRALATRTALARRAATWTTTRAKAAALRIATGTNYICIAYAGGTTTALLARRTLATRTALTREKTVERIIFFTNFIKRFPNNWMENANIICQCNQNHRKWNNLLHWTAATKRRSSKMSVLYVFGLFIQSFPKNWMWM